MAAPHVAGAAALYLQHHPGASPADVANALVGNATPGKINNAGSGSPNLLLNTRPCTIQLTAVSNDEGDKYRFQYSHDCRVGNVDIYEDGVFRARRFFAPGQNQSYVVDSDSPDFFPLGRRGDVQLISVETGVASNFEDINYRD